MELPARQWPPHLSVLSASTDSMRLNAEKIFEMDQAREVFARRLVLDVGAGKAVDEITRQRVVSVPRG